MRRAMTYGVVIVGAGHAGAALAAELRRQNYPGTVLLVSDEDRLPYERPPLSKACIMDGALPPPLLRPADYWRSADIDLALGCRVDALDPTTRVARLSDGRTVAFEWCVLATGGRARPLSCRGANLPGTHVLRNHDDMQLLREDLSRTQALVVVGGGYVGLEIAASARGIGKTVTVIETQSRVLSRVTSAPVSRFFEAAHQRQGVTIRLGRSVAALEGRDRVRAVLLDDGTRIPADTVVVGIGIDAETAIAMRPVSPAMAEFWSIRIFAALPPGVLAIGDCARHPNDFAGGLWRLESVQHAQDSAAVAARTILGQDRVYQDVPTFWSEQYDLRMQSAGIARDADDYVVRGDLDHSPFSIVYLRAGRMIAIDTVNNSREFMAARKLISTRASIDRSLVSDSSVSLRTFA